MIYNFYQQTKKSTQVRRLFVIALTLGCAFGMATQARAQRITPPAIAPGSDESCPNAGAISCLLLQSIGSAKGASWWPVHDQDDLHPALKHRRGVCARYRLRSRHRCG